MKLCKAALIGLAALAGLNATAGAEGERRAGLIVVELFTSQGCNSCPPAEALLGELARRSDVLPLAFHVTYWDQLGWRDRFGLAAADQRQHAYAAALARSSVYTPQFVINGTRDVPLATRERIDAALRQSAPLARIALAPGVSGAIQVELPVLTSGCDCTLWELAVTESAQTAVGGGENRGRTLQEWHIVRSIDLLGDWDGRAGRRVLRTSKRSSDITVVLAQRNGDRHVVAAGALHDAARPPGSPRLPSN